MEIKHILRSAIALLFFFFLSGCSTDDSLPMWINVDEVSLNTTMSQGLNTHNFDHVWLFHDGAPLGVFEVPARIPLLDSDNTSKLSIRPGVRNNAVGSNPIAYQFMDFVEEEFEFIEGETRTINPNFRYGNDVIFSIIEDFESGNIFGIENDTTPSATLTINTADAIYGQRCGHINLEAGRNEFTVASIPMYDVAMLNNSPTYLELDYRSDIAFEVGALTFVGFAGQLEPKVILIPNEDWTKVYIQLDDILLGSGVTEFRLYFRSSSDIGGNVFLDNIKLIHF